MGNWFRVTGRTCQWITHPQLHRIRTFGPLLSRPRLCTSQLSWCLCSNLLYLSLECYEPARAALIHVSQAHFNIHIHLRLIERHSLFVHRTCLHLLCGFSNGGCQGICARRSQHLTVTFRFGLRGPCGLGNPPIVSCFEHIRV